MEAYIIFLFFIFGTIIGSFLNVVILRFHTGRTVGGRSICFLCGKKLRVRELIPLFSFLIQKGKCTSCKSPISKQYPFVEAVTGILFALSAYHFIYVLPISVSMFMVLSLYFSLVFSILVCIVVYDIRHKIIPNEFVYTFILISIIGLFLPTGMNSIHFAWYDIFAGVLIALPFAGLWLVSKGRWMGLGDPKLMIGIGTLLGLSQGIVALTISFWIAAVFGIILLLSQKAHRKTEVPFAPFLVVGFVVAVFCGISAVELFTLFI
jgi:leader peptidase (prepilin peptidase) / N-methyltransferase